MFTRRRFLLRVAGAGGALLGTSLLAACSAAPSTAPAASSPAPAATMSSQATVGPAAAKPGGALVVGFTVDPVSLDPAGPIEYQTRTLRGAIHEALIDTDPSGKPIPWLAESWERKDPTTYEFRLRKGVKFHDGTAFDAEAVKFNIERMKNPATKNAVAAELDNIDRVQVVDSSTVRLIAKAPSAAFLSPLYDVNGMVTSPTAVQKWGPEYGMHPVGTGPFKFVEYRNNVQTVVERNQDYWDKGKPSLERITFRPIPDNNARLTELRTGGVHVAERLPVQNVEQLKSVPELVISEKPGFAVFWLALNLRKPPMDKKEFRQAWSYIIDRDAIRKVAYSNTGAPAWDLFLPGTPFSDPNYMPAKRDVNKAKELIAASGVKTPLEIDVIHENDSQRAQEFQIIQANAAEVGIKLNLQVVDYSTWLTKGSNGELTMAITSWAFRPDADQYLNPNLRSNGGWNWSGYNSPRMDQLLDTQKTELDETKRRQLMRQLAELMTEDAPIVPYIYISNIRGLSAKVKGHVARQDALVRYAGVSLE